MSEPLTALERRALATTLGINRAHDKEGPTQQQLDDHWDSMPADVQTGLLVEWAVGRAAATTSCKEIAAQLARTIVLMLEKPHLYLSRCTCDGPGQCAIHDVTPENTPGDDEYDGENDDDGHPEPPVDLP